MPTSRPIVTNKKRHTGKKVGRFAEGRPNSAIIVLIYIVLVGISLAVFAQTIHYDFVNFDDHLYVYDAPGIKAGLTINAIIHAFTSSHASNWHPLTTLSHILDCQLYGLNAGGHHATNVILHVIAVLLLFRVLQQMTGAVWRSAIVAALFAVHPLHVESVAWVSERKDVLSAVFFFLTLGTYAWYTRAVSARRYLAVVVLFAAGLMSKAMLVSTPIVLLLLDYWPLRRFEQSVSSGENLTGSGQKFVTRFLILEKIPLIVLSTVACVITFLLQKHATGAIPPLPFLWRVENAFMSYMIYAWKTVWPTHLAVFYPHPNDTLPIGEVILAIVSVLAITATAIVYRRRIPYLLTGWFWYLVMLAPVIGIVQVGEQGHADRYTYLPHVGLFVIVVWLSADVAMVRKSPRRLVVTTAVAFLAIFALAWAAFTQASYWRNSETLWNRALAVTADNDVAHNNLGYLCVDRGDLDQAILHFEAAAKIRSGKRDPHYDAGSAFVQMNLADALARKGQSDEAMVHYEEAIKLQPYYADAYYNRGNVLFTKGHVDEAIADWEKTLQIQPNDPDAYTSLGNALLRKGSLREAVADYERALALAPEDPHSRINIAWVLATAPDASIRDGKKAVELAKKAVKLSNTEDPKFLRALAAAYAEAGQFSEAIEVAQRGITTATSQNNLEIAHLLQGDIALYQIGLPLRQTLPGK
ncbi:MAG: tetratricopeptide repeat protein [Candidatus Udaeobacter sp.]